MVPGGGQQDTGPSWRTGEQRTGWCLDRVSPQASLLRNVRSQGWEVEHRGRRKTQSPEGARRRGSLGQQLEHMDCGGRAVLF